MNNASKEGACAGKQKFSNPRLAHRVARRYNGMQHYRCDYCGKWHVGSVAKTCKKR